MRQKKRDRHSPPSKSGISKIDSSTSLTNRITQATLLLKYAFEHGVDFQRREVNLTGEIDDEMFNLLDRALTALEVESNEPITLKINSPGGYCYQAMAMVGRIRESSCQIITKGYGQVMSAACLVLACGNKREMSRHAMLMWHEASYLIGDRHSLNRDYIEQAEKETREWARLMAEFSKKPFEFWLEVGNRKDSYFRPDELKEFGVVDELF